MTRLQDALRRDNTELAELADHLGVSPARAKLALMKAKQKKRLKDNFKRRA